MNSSPKEYKSFTRRQVIGDPQMPEMGYEAHLLSRLTLFSEVTYQEIHSWCALSGKKIAGWEAQAMVVAMKAFRNMEHKARERHCPSPLLSTEEAEMAIADSHWASAQATMGS